MTSITTPLIYGKIWTFYALDAIQNTLDARFFHLCFCVIDFIKAIAKKRKMLVTASYFISFPKLVIREHSYKITII